MKWLISISLFLLSTNVIAGTVTLSCTPPTQNEDGTTLTDLDGYKFYQSTVQGGPYTLVHDEPDETNCGAILTDLVEGTTYYYVATAYNVPGIESAYSGEASKTILAAPPNPPDNLVILDSDLVVYGISQTLDVLVLYPVGTAPPGTPCDNAMTANGKYRVPWSSVIFAGTVKPYVVLASCGSGT